MIWSCLSLFFLTGFLSLFAGLLGCNHFHGAAVNYSSLLLEDGPGLLYVGAREAIYKLDTTNISDTDISLSLEWAASSDQKRQCLSKGKNNQTECYNHVRFLDRYNDTHLYTCGTHAFRPRCAYIDVARFTFVRFEEGKEKCPYDPTKGYTGFIIDGEMYSASQYEFHNIPDIRRNFPFPNLRTDDSPTRWLLESDFVGSALLRESINSSIGDDDKLYFFFTERNTEPTAYSSQTKVARVARVCKVKFRIYLELSPVSKINSQYVLHASINGINKCNSVSCRYSLVQDIQMGSRGCTNITSDGFVMHRTRAVMAGDDVLLQCEIRSNLATPHWTLNGQQLQGYGVDFGYRTGTDGLLIIGTQNQQSGHYRCYAVENGVWVPVRSYVVRVQPVPPPASHLSGSPTALPEKFQNYRHMEAMYISLVAVLGGLCLVLMVVLLYVSFCARNSPNARKYSQQALSVTTAAERKRSSLFELKTISSHCNGRTEGRSRAMSRDGEFLQIVPADIQTTPSKEPPPAPPLPLPPPLPASEYANGLSATLPSVLRKMNRNSYVLLSQTDTEIMSPLYHSFTEELNRILEKRKHTQLDIQPDESSV
uniref:Semaphorin 4G n=1 Tax=Sinocyclocheilus grahami TaxID=75366 RepID=A0A672M8S8_SINGR